MAWLRPSPNPPQASPIPPPLPSPEITAKGETSPPVLTSHGGGKRRPSSPSPCRRALLGGPGSAASSPPCLPRFLCCPHFCSTYAGNYGQRRPGLGYAVLGNGEAAEQIFQQQDSAAALRVEQTARSLTHAFLLRGPCSRSAFAIPCLWLWGVVSPAPGPRGP